MLKILHFLGFLLLYGLWLAAGAWLSKRANKGHQTRSGEAWGFLLILTADLALIVFIYVLTGFFSLSMAAVLVAGLLVGFALGALGSAIWGTPSSRASMIWLAAEVTLTHRALATAVVLIVWVSMIGFPLAIGTIYVTHAFPSASLTLVVIQATFLFVFLTGLPLVVTVISARLASENIGEEERFETLVTGIAGLFQSGLLLALMFWAFGAGGAFSVQDLASVVSPSLFVILVGYFTLVYLLPYAIGSIHTIRAKRARLSREAELLNGLIDALDMPTTSHYGEDLDAARMPIRHDQSVLEEDRMVQLGMALERGEPPPPEATDLVVEVFPEARGKDPRFEHLDWLRHLDQSAARIDEDLAQAASDPLELARVAEGWARVLRNQRDKTGSELKEAMAEKPKAWTFAVAVASAPVMSGLVEALGKWVWSTFSKAGAS